MSGIAGIVRTDGAPVTPDEITAMTSVLAHRGPDGVKQWVEGAVGFGHCLIRTTAAALAESQPWHDETRDLHIVMDGRIDNRGEVAAALGVGSLGEADTSDPALALRCYARWGATGFARLIGDFALAIWDQHRRRLVCARDFQGKRPFYYTFHQGSFRFGSEPPALLVDPSLPREPNEGMVAELLANRLSNTDETLFRHIKRLAPAHFLVLNAGRLSTTRFWDWNPDERLRYGSDDDYAEHLLDLGSAAAEAMASGPWPMGVSLSGGVDSSSVVGLLMHLRKEGRLRASPELFSLVFPGRECDESSHIHAVADMHSLWIHESAPKAVGNQPYEEQIVTHLDVPDYPNLMMHQASFREAADRGIRALFTGKGPDAWLAGSPLRLADHLRRGRFGALTRELRNDTGGLGIPAARRLWNDGVKPLAPPPVRAVRRRLTQRTPCPPHLRHSFWADVDLEARLTPSPLRGPVLASGDAASFLTDGHQIFANELLERSLARAGLEARDPLDDRRVVEFALALPEEQRRRGPITKYVLRQAMAGLVPETVLSRTDKADFAHLFADELRRQGGRALYTSLALVDRGWVDGTAVLSMYDDFESRSRASMPSYPHMWALWATVSIERWLRAIEG